jgi:Uma2 family endonuclease
MVTVSRDSATEGERAATADHRVYMHGLSWDDFERFLALRGEKGPRVTYLEGTLELMSPSFGHDRISRSLAHIVEEYFERLGIEYMSVGSWLLKHAPTEVGLEPDECFVLHDMTKDKPDLAIEVVWTSGGLGKLEVYRRLGIHEVWFWMHDKITFHVLVGDHYEERQASELVPTFDRQLAYELLEIPSTSGLRRALRERLR